VLDDDVDSQTADYTDESGRCPAFRALSMKWDVQLYIWISKLYSFQSPAQRFNVFIMTSEQTNVIAPEAWQPWGAAEHQPPGTFGNRNSLLEGIAPGMGLLQPVV